MFSRPPIQCYLLLHAGVSWRSSTAGNTLTSEKYLVQLHIKRHTTTITCPSGILKARSDPRFMLKPASSCNVPVHTQRNQTRRCITASATSVLTDSFQAFLSLDMISCLATWRSQVIVSYLLQLHVLQWWNGKKKKECVASIAAISF